MSKRYNNYHKHDHKGNHRSLDTVTKEEHYIERCLELGHTHYFTTNHGSKGDVFTSKTLCDKYGVKMVVGSEFYYVDDVDIKERKMYHLVVIALNNEGYKDINRALSFANKYGMYYKPRIDKKTLFSINPQNVIITTACTAGILNRDDREEVLLEFKEYFKDNLYLEVQSHKHINQKNHNQMVIELHAKYDIPIIHANDSHYIYEKDYKYRDTFLKGKGISYPEEDGYILDYPDYNTIIDRYKIQGVLNHNQIEEAIKNTLIFDKCEDITIINDDIKLPSISDNPKRDLKKIIFDKWEDEKKLLDKELHLKYEKEISYEYSMIDECNMDDYFLLDYHIVKTGIEKYGGKLTKTGRGSAVSYYINKLLGFTDIDRISSPVTLYPTRFMSAERILKARSLPDIDINMVSQEPFIKATEDLLGEDKCAWMISYKLLQESSAFRLYCKANDMHVSEYDEVAKDIDGYRDDPKWHDLIKESERFIGVVESISPSPCSMVLYNGIVEDDIGLVNVKGKICCDLDGYNCDKYKYLKNDYLVVSVYELIYNTCELAGIKVPTIKELTELLDDKTFDIYNNKLTCTINQSDSKFATDLIARYGVKSVAEMSAFVASIRPGFASLLDNFIRRKPYSNGIKELDDILKDSFHYMMYQESIMKYLIWLGIDEKDTYDIIKKIAKKKFDEKELDELHSTLESNWISKIGSKDGFKETWQVVQDASKYSFNASHSLSYAYDSLYGAYLKSHYPIEYYTCALNLYDGDVERTPRLIEEMETFGLKLGQPKFRYSKSEYFMDRESNSIYKGIESIKFLNKQVADFLYEIRDKEYKTFSQLLFDIQGHINSRQLEILIKLDFFEEFGKTHKLLEVVRAFNTICTKKTFKYDNEYIEHIKTYANKVTAKQLKEIDYRAVMDSIENSIDNVDIHIQERIKAHFEYMGKCTLKDGAYNGRVCMCVGLDTKYSPKLQVYSIATGTTKEFKIAKKTFKNNTLEVFDMFRIDNVKNKPKKRMIDGKFIASTTEFEFWIETYTKL